MEEKITIISWFIALLSFVGSFIAFFMVKDSLLYIGLLHIAVASTAAAIRYGAIDGPEER